MFHSWPLGHPPCVIVYHGGNLYKTHDFSLREIQGLNICVCHLCLLQHDLTDKATVASDIGVGNIGG